MQFPSCTDFVDSNAHLVAINEWVAASEAAYQHLRGMFDATPAFAQRPEWIGQVADVAHVDLRETPCDAVLETAALRALSGHAMHRGFRIVRICHGSFEEGRERYWSCFAELQKL